jgi:hypothetical protein
MAPALRRPACARRWGRWCSDPGRVLLRVSFMVAFTAPRAQVESLVPVLVELKRVLEAARSALLGELLATLRTLLRDHKAEVGRLGSVYMCCTCAQWRTAQMATGQTRKDIRLSACAASPVHTVKPIILSFEGLQRCRAPVSLCRIACIHMQVGAIPFKHTLRTCSRTVLPAVHTQRDPWHCRACLRARSSATSWRATSSSWTSCCTT